MTTQTILKARLASELRRSDLTTQIAAAITTAISAYQGDRFNFNLTRAFTFATVDGQEFYTSADDADLGNIEKFDYVKLYVSNQPYTLYPLPSDIMEMRSQNGTSEGQPTNYCWYAESMRLYPVPDAVYTVRIGCIKTLAAPATDGEASNPWMTTAERLIRCRAKYELFEHVMLNREMASLYHPDNEAGPTHEAFSQLRKQANRKESAEGVYIRPTAF